MSKKLNEQALIKQYINICNDVLLKHRQSALLKEILAIINRNYAEDNISFKITDDNGTPLATYTTRFVDGTFMPVEEDSHHPDTRLALKRSYLKEVVEHTEEYMDHPAKLDWDWLTGDVKPI